MKIRQFIKALLWGMLIIIFPVISGTLSSIYKLGTIATLFLQGACMLLGLIPVLAMLLAKKWRPAEIGIAAPEKYGCRKALYFAPVVLIYIPLLVRGFSAKSAAYFIGTLFLYLSVGIAEEIYFRGIVTHFLGKAFSQKGVVVCSSVIFCVGHSATALTGQGIPETLLTILNAFIFGFLAIELALLVKSIGPLFVIHFLFDFESKFTAISGKERLAAEIVRGAVITLLAIWLAIILHKEKA